MYYKSSLRRSCHCVSRRRPVPRRLSVLDRLRSRWRAVVHGLERLQPALRRGALAENRLRGRKGLSEGGGV